MKMNSLDNNVIETILKKKLEFADKALGLLPPGVRPAVKNLQIQALTSLRDSLDQYLKYDRPDKSESILKKINLE